MENFLGRFRLKHEREDYEKIVESITNGVSFRGTNLWILIFAIFIASLGLNVNSPAVIIGAMLISPLMGPIMGLGLGLGINDLSLVRRALSNFGYAVGVSMATSTLYFLITPINEAHSELLARTYPTIYDVLIAFFGGLAGIVATSSKLKGNVIPGVAIATALMPPLCTAGYGLATLHWNYFFGALYLFLINSVFIAAATLLTVRLLKLPFKHLPNARAETKARRIITAILIVTIAPSIYFAYNIIQQETFTRNANKYINSVSVLPDDYLLNKEIDSKEKCIKLVYGGKEISDSMEKELEKKLIDFDLHNAKLEIKQGFALLNDDNDEKNQKFTQLSNALTSKENEIKILKSQLDSLNRMEDVGKEIFNELKIQYPDLKSVTINPAKITNADKPQENILIALIGFRGKTKDAEQNKIEDWLKVRLKNDHIKIIFTN